MLSFCRIMVMEGGAVMSKLKNNEIISLLSIYEEEWRYRDSAWFSRMFKMNFISFITILIPYLEEYFKIKLPNVSNAVFPIIGIVIATLSFVFSLMYARRLKAIGDSIWNLNHCLKPRYRMERIPSSGLGKIFKLRISWFLSTAVYVLLLVLALFIIHTV